MLSPDLPLANVRAIFNPLIFKKFPPIEIAAVVVWRVVDTAEAIFEVDDYENYVTIQSEAALRNLATTYPYEHDAEDERLSLRSDANAIALKLKSEVQDRLQKAGVDVLEAR